jgi:hypothetical protein
MKPVLHETSTHMIGPPLTWEIGAVISEAQPIPVTITDTKDAETIASYWKPSYEELQALIEGGSIQLILAGAVMPLVSLEVVE